MKKEDIIIKMIEESKESTNTRLDSIDANLAEHMRRTDVLEQLHKDNQERIALLEEPRKALKLVKEIALWITSIGGAVLLILKLSDKI